MDRRLLVAACFAAVVSLGSHARAQDAIEPLPGAHEQQQIEVIQPQGQEQVEVITDAGEQEVAKNEIPSPFRRGLSTAGKIVVVALATAVGLAASAASLIFL